MHSLAVSECIVSGAIMRKLAQVEAYWPSDSIASCCRLRLACCGTEAHAREAGVVAGIVATHAAISCVGRPGGVAYRYREIIYPEIKLVGRAIEL